MWRQQAHNRACPNTQNHTDTQEKISDSIGVQSAQPKTGRDIHVHCATTQTHPKAGEEAGEVQAETEQAAVIWCKYIIHINRYHWHVSELTLVIFGLAGFTIGRRNRQEIGESRETSRNVRGAVKFPGRNQTSRTELCESHGFCVWTHIWSLLW